jgi:hypothetical protein
MARQLEQRAWKGGSFIIEKIPYMTLRKLLIPSLALKTFFFPI